MSNDQDSQYFKYYSQLQHQQNMLQDNVRTSTYRKAIMLNRKEFNNKLVLDVGAGSGILSYFAIQAGANHVYAVEASNMADKMMKLICSEKNKYLRDKISIVNEQQNLNIPKVDTIISEPIGVLLLHERMLDSFIYARDHYLKPGGTVFPSQGVIHLAPFTDTRLWKETKSNANFWQHNSFYGVDLTSLYNDACKELFGMPVIGKFDYKSIMTTNKTEFNINFNSITMDALHDMTIPFQWTCSRTGMVNGISGWFDIVFDPPQGTQVTLSTSPLTDITHWYQTRFLFTDPLPVKSQQSIQGWMRCIANNYRSYTIYIELIVGDQELSDPSLLFTDVTNLSEFKRRGVWELQEQTYDNNQFTPSQ
ncbi:S-adenosyl-L-methionine-dependent methyltransferase [Thamnidium elegans]|nr:S-adenosyl-L-methionine-dependent methyltransferase [Thamnidium elegans]